MIIEPRRGDMIIGLKIDNLKPRRGDMIIELTTSPPPPFKGGT